MSSKKQVEGRRGSSDGGAAGAAGPVTLAVTAAVAGMLGQPAEAAKNIKVERVARGQARFDSRGNNTRITVSDRAIINYSKFDIPKNNAVRFVQPSASSKVLNRINSAVPSKIDGSLSANGIVYLVNPAGVRFGPNSVINVGQLYAAAANISDGDFMNGINRFVDAQGAVVNAGGHIEADAVTLVGRQVINSGVVLGKDAVTMVSGEDVLVGEKDGFIFVKVGTVKGLTDAAATGARAPTRGPGAFGSGDMFSVAAQHSGKAKAKQITVQSDGLTVVSGQLDASAAGAGQKGGTVKVLGQNVAVVGAKIDASGPAGGGTVLVGGDFQGQGDTQRAAKTLVTGGSVIEVDATDSGNGGKVVVWSDKLTWFFGSISAKGGPNGGNGGVVEVSGKQSLKFEGQVDTTAPSGEMGSLLLDPEKIKLVAAGPGDDAQLDADQPNTGDPIGQILATDGAGTFNISKVKLESLVGTTAVILQAGKEITADAGVTSLDFNLTGGSVTMQTTDTTGGPIIDLSGVDLTTKGVPVSLSSSGELKVKSINTANGAVAAGGSVSLIATGPLTATGEIKTAGTTTGAPVNVNGGGLVTLDKVTTNAAGGTTDVTIAGTGGVVLNNTISTGNGATISVTSSGGNITGAGQLEAGANGTVSLTSGAPAGTIGTAIAPVKTLAGNLVINSPNFNVENAVGTVLKDVRITTADVVDNFYKLAGDGVTFTVTHAVAENFKITDISAVAGKEFDFRLNVTGAPVIDVTKIALPGKDVRLTTGGSVNGISAGTDIVSGALSVNAAGAVDLVTEVSGVTNINAGASGDVTLNVPAGNLTLGTIVGRNVTVDVAAGNVLTPDNTVTHVTADGAVDIETAATFAIGTDAAHPLNLDADGQIKLTAGSDLHVQLKKAGAVDITAASAGSVTFAYDGETNHELKYGAAEDLTLGTEGNITHAALAGNISANVLTLNAGAAGSIGAGAGSPVRVDAVRVNASAPGGGVALRDAAGGLEIGPIAAAGAVSVVSDQGDLTLNGAVSGSTVSLSAGRHIVNAAAPADRVAATTTVTIAAGTDAAETNGRIGTAAAPVRTTATALDLTAKGNNATDSAIVVKELDGVTLTKAATGQGDVNVELETAGDLVVGNVTGGNVTLKTFDGSITEGTGGKVESNGAASVVTITAGGTAKTVGTTANSLDIDAEGTTVSVSAGSGPTGGSVYVKVLAAGDLNVATPGVGVTSSLKNVTTTYDFTYKNDLTVEAPSAITNNDDKTIKADQNLRLTSATDGIGTGAKPIITEAAGLSADAKGTGGVFIKEKDDASINGTGITTVDRNVEVVSDTASLTLASDVNAGVGDVTIRAANDIRGGAGTIIADAVTLEAGTVALDGNVGAVATVQTRANSLDITGKGAGKIDVSDLKPTGAALELIRAKTGSGDVSVTSQRTMKVSGVETTGKVNLVANTGAILDRNELATDVKGGEISLTAVTGIGFADAGAGAPARLDLAGQKIAATTPNGGILLSNDGTGLLAAAEATLNAATSGAIDLEQTGAADLTVKQATAGAGNVTVVNTAQALTIDGAITAGGGNDVVLRAGQAVSRASGTVGGDDVTIEAGTLGVGNHAIGTDAARVETEANTLDLTASGTGAIFVNEGNAVTVKSARSGDGDVVVRSGDSMTVGGAGGGVPAVQTGAAGRVALRATTGQIIDGNGADVNVASGSLSLQATSLVGNTGNQFDTQVGAIAVATTSGGVFVNNASANLTVGEVQGVDAGNIVGISSNGSPIELTQTGNLTVDRAINAGGSSVKVELTGAGSLLTNNSTITGTGSGAGNDGLTLIADRMALGASPGQLVDAGAQVLVVRPHAANRAIKFGVEDAGALSLDQNELNTLKSSQRVIIGDAAAGDVSFHNATAFDLPQATMLSLVTGAAVIGHVGANAVLTNEDLSIEAQTGIGASQRLVLDVPKLAAKSPAGNIDIRNVRDLDVTTVAGVSGISAGDYDVTPAVAGGDIRLQTDNNLVVSEQIRAGGKIDILSGAAVDVNAAVTSGAGKTAPFNEATLTESVTISAGGNVSVDAEVTGLKDVTITSSGGDATFNADAFAQHGNLTVNARNILSPAPVPPGGTPGNLSAKYDVTLNATAGKVDVAGNVTAGRTPVVTPPEAPSPNGKIDVDATTDIITSGQLAAKTSVDLDAGQNITLQNTVVATDQYVKATAGNTIKTELGGTIGAGTDVDLTAMAGNVEIGRDVTATAGHIHATANGAAGNVSTAAGATLDDGANFAAGTDVTLSAGQNVTTGGKVLAGTFVQATTITGDVDVRNSVTATAQHIHGTAGRDVKSTADGKLDANTDVTLVSGRHVETDGTIDAGTFVDIHALGGRVSLDGAVTAQTQSIKADADAGNVDTTATLNAKTFVDLDASADINVGAPVTAQDQQITADAGGNVNVHGAMTAGTFITANAATGDVNVTQASRAIGNHIVATAGKNVTTSGAGTLDAGTHIHLTANDGDVSVGAKADAGAEIEATASRSVLSTPAGELEAGTHIRLTASGGNVDLQAKATATGAFIEATASNSILTTAAAELFAGTRVTLTAIGGNVTTDGKITGDTQEIVATAGGSVTTSGELDAGTHIALTASGGDVTVAAKATAGDHIVATASQSVITTPTGELVAGDHILLTANGANVDVNAKATAGTHIEAKAQNSVLTSTGGELFAGTYVMLDAITGDVTTAGKITGDTQHIEATAGKAVTTTGEMDAGTHIHLTALDGDVSIGAKATAGTDIEAVASKSVLSTPAGEMLAGTHIELTANGGNVDLQAKATATGDYIEAIASNSILTTAAAELFAGTRVTLNAIGGDVTTAGKITGDTQEIEATAGQSVTTTGELDAGTFIRLTANGGDVNVGAPAGAGTFIEATASQSVITTPAGTLNAGGYIQLTANGANVDLNADATAGAHIQATAKDSVLTSVAADLLAGTYVRLIATDGQVNTAGTVTAQTQQIEMTAGTSVITTGELDAGTSITLLAQGGNVDVGANATAGTFIDATASGSVINTGELFAGTHVSLLAQGGDVRIDAPVTADTDFILAQAPLGSVLTFDPIDAGTSIRLLAGVNVEVGGNATAGTTILADAGNDVLTTGELRAGQSITLDAGNNIHVQNLAQAGTFIHGIAGQDITTDGVLDAGSFILLEAGSDITINQLAQAGTTITARATSGNVTNNGPLDAGTDVLLDAGTDVIVNATIDAGGNIDAVAGQDISSTTLGVMTAGGHIELTAARDISTLGDASANGSFLTFTAGRDIFGSSALHANTVLTLDAGNDILFVGRSTSGGDTLFRAGHDITANGSSVFAGGSVIFLAGNNINSTGSVRAIVDVTFDAGNDINTEGTVDAGAAIVFDAGNDINNNATVTAGSTVLFTAASDINSGAPVNAGQSITMNAVGGNIRTTPTGTMEAGTFVKLDALNGLIDLQADVTAQSGNIEATAGGDITTSVGADLDAGTDVILRSNAGSIRTSGSVGAGVDILANAAVDIDALGNWTAGRDLSATAGNDISVQAKLEYGRSGTLLAGQNVAFSNGGSMVKLGSDGQTLVTATSGDVTMAAGTLIDGGGSTVGINAGSDIQLALVRSTFNAANTAAVTLRAGSGSISDLHSFNEASGAIGDASVIATGGGLDAQAGASIDLGTQVAWVEAQTLGTGALTLHEIDAIDLRRVISANGLVTLRSGAQMNVGQVVAGGDADANLRTYSGNIDFNPLTGTVTAAGDTIFLDAAASIVGNIARVNVTSDRLEADAGNEITLGTDVETIRSASAGNTLIHDFGSVTLEEVLTSGGDVDVRADDSMTVALVRAGTAGDRDVSLTAGQNITGSGAASNVLADLLTMRAGGDITLNTRVVTVDSESGGDTTLVEADAITLQHVKSTGGNIAVTADGQMNVRDVEGPTSGGATIRLETTQNITGIELPTNVIGDALITIAGGEIDLNTRVNSLTSQSGGNATFNEADDLAIITVTTPATFDLTAGGAVTDGNGRRLNVSADVFTLDSRSADLDINVNDLFVTARGGNVNLNERDSMDVRRLDFVARRNRGNLRLSARDMRIFLDRVNTKRGTQTYTGAIDLMGAGDTFTFNGRGVSFVNGVELDTNGKALDVAAPLSGSGLASIDSEGGNVIARKGINGSLDLSVNTRFSTAANPAKDPNQKLGNFTVTGSTTVKDLDVLAGTIDVGAITADGGGIDLSSDPRLVLESVPIKEGAGGATTASNVLRPKGVIKLRGNLTATGDIVLGSSERFFTPGTGQGAVPPVPLNATSTINEVPNVATIIVLGQDLTADTTTAQLRAGTFDFTIKGSQFTMRPLEKMTVMGNMTIDAAKVTLSDISALGKLEVITESANFQFRNPGFLLTRNGVVGGKADLDVDFYANDGISFVPHAGRSLTINASPAGSGNDFVSFGVGPSIANVGGFRFRRKSQPSEVADFVYVLTEPGGGGAATDIIVLDATPDGPSSTDISGTLTQAIPQETPTPTEETNLSDTALKRLVEFGVYGRMLDDKEKVEKAMGLVLYLDVLPQRHQYSPRNDDWTVVVGKLPRENTQPLIDLDDELYGKGLEASTPEHRKGVDDAAKSELASAVGEYRDLNPEVVDEIDPEDFTRFLRENQAKYPKAFRHLEVTGEMLERVQSLGLTKKQLDICRSALLGKVAPPGALIQRQELEKVARELFKRRLAMRQSGSQARQ